eukprot:gnl/Hemi2/1986_TR710_c0_g5_i1.p1 gnl/Hemi2/1986_TR710_c0_g5~~gnl/Hemi2/1986_TR710_c0_g5_i1.p1  ORF type:complete len:340 (-),score=117.92 gnl/Hemi2/1986_TR710_c0_g5_i1:65-1084(-)
MADTNRSARAPAAPSKPPPPPPPPKSLDALLAEKESYIQQLEEENSYLKQQWNNVMRANAELMDELGFLKEDKKILNEQVLSLRKSNERMQCDLEEVRTEHLSLVLENLTKEQQLKSMHDDFMQQKNTIDNFRKTLELNESEKKDLMEATTKLMSSKVSYEEKTANLQQSIEALEEKLESYESIQGVLGMMTKDSAFPRGINCCRRLEDKLKLLDLAVESQVPDVVKMVLIFLENTLREEQVFKAVGERPFALTHFVCYLKEQREFGKLSRLYQAVGTPLEQAMSLLREVYAQPANEQLEGLKQLLSFFQQHPSLKWYTDELSNHIYDVQRQTQSAQAD